MPYVKVKYTMAYNSRSRHRKKSILLSKDSLGRGRSNGGRYFALRPKFFFLCLFLQKIRPNIFFKFTYKYYLKAVSEEKQRFEEDA